MNYIAGRVQLPWEQPPEQGEALQVAEGLYWIRLPLPMKLDHVNVYALDDADGWTIIDTGMGSRKTKGIWGTVLEGPLAGKPVKRVILTHHHPDHVGLAGWFQHEHGAEIWATRTAWLMARMLTLDVQETPPPETLAFWQRAGMNPQILAERASGKVFNFADTVSPIPLGYKRILQDDVLTMGGRDWTVHIGNGHAPEHATFWSHSDNLVIAGDQIISSISPNLGVYATEPEADSVGEWLESCERLSRTAKAEHMVFSGHKLPFTGLPFRLKQLIDNHHSALARLLTFLETPHSAAECFQPLFKRRIGEGEYGLALVESIAHLNHLFKEGKVVRSLDSDGAYRFQKV